MTDITQPENGPSDPRAAAIRSGVETYIAVVEHNNDLLRRLDETVLELARLRSEVDITSRDRDRLAAERDHYMRRSVELSETIDQIKATISREQTRDAHSPFRPNGRRPLPEREGGKEPIPSFLLPSSEEEKRLLSSLEEELKKDETTK
jgi:hypothetical protein